MHCRLFPIITIMLCCYCDMLYAQEQQDTIRLKEVGVRAKALSAPGTSVSTTLHQHQLEQSKGASLGDVLKNISGVHVLKTGPAIAKPVIHGLHSNRILILNNGVRLESQAWGAEHAPEIDPLIAEQLTLIKGAESVRYGAEAIGGIVLVTPPDLFAAAGTGGSLNTIAASNGRSLTTAGMLKGGWNKFPGFGWRVQGSYKKAGNVRTANYTLGNTGLREFNYSAAAGYRSSRTVYEAYFSQFSTTLGILYSAHAGTVADIAARIAAGKPSENYDFNYTITAPRQRIFHHLGKLSAHHHLGNGNTLNFEYSVQRNHRKEFDRRRGDREALPITDLVLQSHTLNIDLSKQYDSAFKRTIGINGMAQVNNNIPGTLANTFIPNYDSFSSGIFAIQKWKRQDWELEAGLRYDFKWFDAAGFRYLQNSGENTDSPSGQYYGGQNEFHNVTGSFAIQHQLSAHWYLTSNLGLAWRAPTANELFSNGLHHGSGLYEIGNANLKSEQGYKWVNALKYQSTSFFSELDLYGQYLSNYIYSRPDLVFRQTLSGTYPVFRYQQTNASFFGADLTAKYRILPLLSYQINASLVLAKDLRQENYLPYIPPFRIDQNLRMDIKIRTLSEMYLQFGHNYTGRQNRYDAGSDYASPPPAYHLFQLMAGASLEKSERQWHLHAGIDNLFNIAYKDYMNRYRYYAHDLGRNLTLRISYTF